MKRILNSKLFFFILGALVFGTVSAVFAYSYTADQIGFTPIDTNWNVDNNKAALDWLYNFEAKKLVNYNMFFVEYNQHFAVKLDYENIRNIFSKFKIKFGWHDGDLCYAYNVKYDKNNNETFGEKITLGNEYLIDKTAYQHQIIFYGNGSWCNFILALYN